MTSFALWSVPIATGLAYAPHFTRVGILFRHSVFDAKEPREINSTKDPATDKLIERLGFAHVNQLETLGLYAGGIAVAIATDVPPKRTTQLAAIYISSRALYTLAYANPQLLKGLLRTACFTVSLSAALALWGHAAQRIKH